MIHILLRFNSINQLGWYEHNPSIENANVQTFDLLLGYRRRFSDRIKGLQIAKNTTCTIFTNRIQVSKGLILGLLHLKEHISRIFTIFFTINCSFLGNISQKEPSLIHAIFISAQNCQIGTAVGELSSCF